MARTQLPAFTKVSEWLAAIDFGADTLGLTNKGKQAQKMFNTFCVISCEAVSNETEKAIGVKGIRWNQCANAKPATVWIPKSQIKEIENDYYTNNADRMFIVPMWLIKAKEQEGYEFP